MNVYVYDVVVASRRIVIEVSFVAYYLLLILNSIHYYYS